MKYDALKWQALSDVTRRRSVAPSGLNWTLPAPRQHGEPASGRGAIVTGATLIFQS